MNSAPAAAAIPGGRIDNYRNSSPRLIRLLGLGDVGGKVVRIVAQRGRANVDVLTDAGPVGWAELAKDRPGTRTNMIVIVCAEGDERLFRPEHGKPDMLITFVLLQHTGDPHAASEQRLANARGVSDLFVTTSDADYVSELIDNLAS